MEGVSRPELQKLSQVRVLTLIPTNECVGKMFSGHPNNDEPLYMALYTKPLTNIKRFKALSYRHKEAVNHNGIYLPRNLSQILRSIWSYNPECLEELWVDVLCTQIIKQPLHHSFTYMGVVYKHAFVYGAWAMSEQDLYEALTRGWMFQEMRYGRYSKWTWDNIKRLGIGIEETMRTLNCAFIPQKEFDKELNWDWNLDKSEKEVHRDMWVKNMKKTWMLTVLSYVTSDLTVEGDREHAILGMQKDVGLSDARKDESYHLYVTGTRLKSLFKIVDDQIPDYIIASNKFINCIISKIRADMDIYTLVITGQLSDFDITLNPYHKKLEVEELNGLVSKFQKLKITDRYGKTIKQKSGLFGIF